MIKLIKVLICSFLCLNIQYTQTVSFKNLWKKTKKTCSTIKNKYPSTVISITTSAAAAACFYYSDKNNQQLEALARSCIFLYDWRLRNIQNKIDYINSLDWRKGGPPPGSKYVLVKHAFYRKYCWSSKCAAQIEALANRAALFALSLIAFSAISLSRIGPAIDEWLPKNNVEKDTNGQATEKADSLAIVCAKKRFLVK